MAKKVFFCSVFLFQFLLYAQEDAWVYLTDKENVSSSIANPITILTQKAIDRKSRHGVSIDERDVPVNPNYINQLKNATGITVLAKSKWLNAVHVRGELADIENLLTNPSLTFIDSIEFANKNLTSSKGSLEKKILKTELTVVADYNYGNALNQTEMIKVDQLHLNSFTGSGITVAVLDSGFPNVDTMEAFKRLRDAGGIIGVYDFVDRDTDVYTNTTSNHGTLVLSTMAGYIEDEYVGTAPDADYYLFTTEDGGNENPVEESYWVEAAERADSLGVDIINTSLGYGSFYDKANYNYDASDFNGYTTFITRGANIASEKGLLIVCAAGNEGSAGVNAPADSPVVFSVGAVDATGNYASFSSMGNAFQPTQKPDVVAQGQASYVIREDDAIVASSGTSFSSPILAGGMACLWQALPEKTPLELMQLVRESASQYTNPDNFLGYGIPNLEQALANVLNSSSVADKLAGVKMYPNPASHTLFFSLEENKDYTIGIFDVSGKRVIEWVPSSSNPQISIVSLLAGMYFVKVYCSDSTQTFKLIKQ